MDKCLRNVAKFSIRNLLVILNLTNGLFLLLLRIFDSRLTIDFIYILWTDHICWILLRSGQSVLKFSDYMFIVDLFLFIKHWHGTSLLVGWLREDPLFLIITNASLLLTLSNNWILQNRILIWKYSFVDDKIWTHIRRDEYWLIGKASIIHFNISGLVRIIVIHYVDFGINQVLIAAICLFALLSERWKLRWRLLINVIVMACPRIATRFLDRRLGPHAGTAIAWSFALHIYFCNIILVFIIVNSNPSQRL